MFARLTSFLILTLVVSVVSVVAASAVKAQDEYTLFESGQVRPMAMSPSGVWLYVANTPDAHVEAYALGGTGGATHIFSIPVGLEPVAIAAPNNDEIWVVNHLSDSISIVDTTLTPPRVVRTLLVGDEPRDIVIASGKAFITTAHRGQNTPWQDGDFDTPGIGRADVWVFDVANPGAGMGGTPLTVINLFGDRPRALAASPDGTRVYAAVFRSGNQTVPINEGLVCNGSSSCLLQGNIYPGGRPDPETNWQGITSRETGLIVGYDEGSGFWLDEFGRNWSTAVPFDLPDYDVFEIDAAASTPVQLGPLAGGITEGVAHVGTTLFNMVVNPVNGDVYVSNTDANNRVRFEGEGNYVGIIGPKSSGDPASIRGELAKSRVTVLDASGDSGGTPETEFSVIPQELNTHIPYGVAPVPAGVEDKSIATPTEMAISSDGTTLYVAGFGSRSVHIYDTTELKNGTFTPNTGDIIALPSMLGGGITGGASGLVLDEVRGRLYVTSRGTNETYIFNTSDKSLVATLRPHNPEPAEVIDGRPFLYDARLTGSNGEASCSSCHIFGDMDDLSWDLGNPDGSPFANNNPLPAFVPIPGSNPPNDLGDLPSPQPFDPLKGPMTTQSLRGMVNSGPQHWRGDRTGPACEAGIDLNRDPTCEIQAFTEFQAAFGGLLGRDAGPLAPGDMTAFTDFALRLTYPPNPIRNLDNSLTSTQQDGADLFSGRNTDVVTNCVGCHALDRAAGFFGTSGGTTFENEVMEFKVPHLRNAYQKVGMFGHMPSVFFPDAPGIHMGPQVRGTGSMHDGSAPRTFDFLAAEAFDLGPGVGLPELSPAEQSDLEAFMMAFDSDLAPIVGQQITLTDTNLVDVQGRIDLLIERSGTQLPGTVELECELIVKGVVNGERRGWLRTGSLGTPMFLSDKQTEALWTKAELLALATVPDQALTFTCAPPSNGFRMSVDRDRDNFWDNDDPFPDFFNSPDCGVGRTTPSGSAGSLLFLMLLGVFSRRLTIGRRRRS